MSNKPLDKVNEAYKGEMGKGFAEQTRNRINWIVNHVKGSKVLDIGCSQGIVPIILGREGKIVNAIDIAEESIEYAKNELKNEHLSVQKNVQFKVSNFMTEDDLDPEYETILLTEVLEHIGDTDSFLQKIFQHLSQSGYFILTVPFGINDYFDHKRTYYFLDLYDHISPYFSIEKIEFIGKWTGLVCKKNLNNSSFSNIELFSRQYLVDLEKAFFIVERDYLDKIDQLQMDFKNKNSYIDNLIKQKTAVEVLIKEKETYIEELRKEIDYLKSQLNISLANEEKALKTILRNKDEIGRLEKTLHHVESRYAALKNSKIGILILKYWNFMKRIRR